MFAPEGEVAWMGAKADSQILASATQKLGEGKPGSWLLPPKCSQVQLPFDSPPRSEHCRPSGLQPLDIFILQYQLDTAKEREDERGG